MMSGDSPSSGPISSAGTQGGVDGPNDGQAEDPAKLRASVENAKRVVGRGRNGTLTRHWPDILVVLASVTLLPWLVVVLAGVVGRDRPAPEPIASADLTAFTVLQAEHMAKLEGKADSLRKKLAGHYLLRAIAKGSPVRAAELGPASLSPALLQGRHVLPLQLVAGAAPDSLRAGTIADLLLSPATPTPGASPVFVQRVPVLAVTAAGEGVRVVVAVDRAQLDALAPRIGSSRVFVLTGGGAPALARDTGRAPADSTGG